MATINPKDVSNQEFYRLLTGTITPRPIAFASTIDKAGNVNLSPFSFFNVFSSNPPVMVFSPARRGRDNTTKDTLENVLEVPEVTISVVNYAMVEQMSLASTEYPKGINEYEKAGFTPVKSKTVKPPYVKESPAAFECSVLEVKALGKEGGAGNLVICEVQLAHISDEIFSNGLVDPYKLDAVARMGSNYYSRVQGDSIFEVVKPLTHVGIGVDRIPKSIRNSSILTGNHLGKLGNVEKMPSQNEIEKFATEPEISAILQDTDANPDQIQIELHKLAIRHLDHGNVLAAWKVLLQEY